jgi:hypothetical protein
MADNGADFSADSQGGKTVILYNALITEIQTLIANQISGSDNKNQGHNVKDDAVDNLREEITQINLAAKAMADEMQAIENKFRLPYTRSLPVLIGTSRSFLNDAAPIPRLFAGKKSLAEIIS